MSVRDLVGRACLVFTRSWRDHRILLFYSNSTSLHKVNPLGLRIGQDTDNSHNYIVRSIGPEDCYGEACFRCQVLMSTEI
jgi:hypothetical protein